MLSALRRGWLTSTDEAEYPGDVQSEAFPSPQCEKEEAAWQVRLAQEEEKEHSLLSLPGWLQHSFCLAWPSKIKACCCCLCRKIIWQLILEVCWFCCLGFFVCAIPSLNFWMLGASRWWCRCGRSLVLSRQILLQEGVAAAPSLTWICSKSSKCGGAEKSSESTTAVFGMKKMPLGGRGMAG